LSQECKCVKIVDDSHQHFVSSIRWAPDVPVQPATNGETNGNGFAVGKKEDLGKIRCVLATASVDQNVRVFAG
jgi:platelet-activating factor acetylhydrolase IB subunit alpha